MKNKTMEKFVCENILISFNLKMIFLNKQLVTSNPFVFLLDVKGRQNNIIFLGMSICSSRLTNSSAKCN